jgi:hypothetical protein
MLLSALLFAAPAFPCAGIFHAAGKLAESDSQEVILEQLSDGVRVHYSVVYDGDSADFGWVIAVPGAVSALADGDIVLFDDVRNYTAPTVEWYSDYASSGCGCFGASKGGDALNADTAEGRANGVTILAEGFTGTYDYTLLAATDASELTDWLDDNGWSAGGAESEFAAYVADGWQFAALKVTPDEADTPEDGRSLPPVMIDYQGDLAFPARMALSSPLDAQRTTIYVLGDQAARVSDGWGQAELSEINGSDGDDPEQLFRDALWDNAGDSAVYSRTFSAALPSSTYWVSRFDTYAARDAHTADPYFALDAGEERADVYIVIESYADRSAAPLPGRALLLSPLLAGLLFSLRRRRY